MIIRGRFIGDAPYFAVKLQSLNFHGMIWFLADTGASHTTLLDRDVKLLGISQRALEPLSSPIVGIGGSVRSFSTRDVKFTFASDEGDRELQEDLYVIQHDLERLPPEEVSRILRLPSVLGRDLINRFHFSYDYRTGIVQLEHRNIEV